MPISGPSALILLSVLAEYGVKIDFLQWVLVGAPTMTVVCVAVYVFSNSELERIFSNFFFCNLLLNFRNSFSEKFKNIRCEIRGNLRIYRSSTSDV